jgi:hypothetical protein
MPAVFLDRRHFLAAVSVAGLAAQRRAVAQPSITDIDHRLAQAERAGTVSGLHALLVSQRGKLGIAASTAGINGRGAAMSLLGV